MIPGEYILRKEPVTCNEGREAITLEVINRGDRPVQVGSHYHIAEANPDLEFDREKALGHRLDILAGTAVRLEPGDKTTVSLIPFAGDRIVYGFRDLVDGPLDIREPKAFKNDKAQHSHQLPERHESAAGDPPEPLQTLDENISSTNGAEEKRK